MTEIAAVAERLRMVNEAYHRFLGLWALDCLLERTSERFAQRLEQQADESVDGQRVFDEGL